MYGWSIRSPIPMAGDGIVRFLCLRCPSLRRRWPHQARVISSSNTTAPKHAPRMIHFVLDEESSSVNASTAATGCSDAVVFEGSTFLLRFLQNAKELFSARWTAKLGHALVPVMPSIVNVRKFARKVNCCTVRFDALTGFSVSVRNCRVGSLKTASGIVFSEFLWRYLDMMDKQQL